MQRVVVRREGPGDVEAVRGVNLLAFGQQQEADVVEALRKAGAATLSMVADLDGAIAGHILFSPVRVQSTRSSYDAIGLGPMAVAPDLQCKGIGSQLVRAGLQELRRLGHEIVVVLGPPEYYPRFGFERASLRGIRWEHDAPDEAFMVLELCEGALASRGAGVVRYRPEFESVSA
jgi:putative acetyltransferase